MSIERDQVFVALTRPQMFAGVTYSYVVINAVLAVELFLIFRAVWAIAGALLIHGGGVLLCLPRRYVDLFASMRARVLT